MKGIAVLDLVIVLGVTGCCFVLVCVRPAPPRLVGARGRRTRAWGSTVGLPGWLALFLGVVVALAFGSPVVAVTGPLLTAFGRRELRRRRSRVAFNDRATMALGFVVAATSGLRAGRSLAGAVLGEAAPGEGLHEMNLLRDEVAERVQAGRPFALAVDEVLGAGSVDERLIATTIRALDATGAAAGNALERVAEALGERQSSRDDARTQAQHALSSAGVLAALPFVFGVAAALAEPDVARLYASTWLGAVCAGISLLLNFGSWEWLQRLLGSSR